MPATEPKSIRWIRATGTTSAAVTLTDGVAPRSLCVIDTITGGVSLGAAGDKAQVKLQSTQISAFTLWAQSAPAIDLTRGFNLFFDDGLPIWSASDTDTAVATGIVVTATSSGTATVCDIVVGYHWELPMERRL